MKYYGIRKIKEDYLNEIEDKSEILTLLEDTYGLKKEFGNTKKLF